MPKDKLTDYDSTASNNLDVGGISVAEGMLPSAVNNAIREQMSHLADFAAGTSGVDVLKLQDDTDTNSIKLQAPSSVTADTTFTLPDGDGSADQVLKTDGSGQLGWADRHANPSLIINGQMTVAQRGTSSTSTGYQTVDRWLAAFGGSGAAVTQSQESLSSSDAPYALGLRNYFRSTVTGTSTDTGAYHQILQYVEAQNMAQSGWNFTSTSSYITLSFWVRSSVAGTYTVYFQSKDGTEQIYAHEFTLSANTWTKVTKTVPGNSNITINNDNGQGLLVNVVAHFGTDYTTSGSTTNAWKAADVADVTEDYAQNWLNTSGATFDLTGVKLEVGETATPFEHRSYGDELARCQRYLKLGGAGVYGIYNSAANIEISIPLNPNMRAAPTLSMAKTTVTISNKTNSNTATATSVSAVNISSSPSGVYFAQIGNCNVTSASAGHIAQFRTDEFLQLDAEL